MEEGETSASSDHAARPWQSYHTVFTNAKAGMDGVDKEKVQRVVYEMSKGSKYFENEERKEAEIKQKVDAMRARCANLTANDIAHFQEAADRRISELEATRDLSRIWLHVDMDAFYAAVETLSNSSLAGKPMAVGSLSMISTANYEARKFGVRAAMPGFIARKLCPHLTFVPVDFKKYTHYSGLIRKVLERYDPNFMAPSLDEAYLDITDICKERGIISDEIAEEMRRTVNAETGLTCSAGVAPNRLLAKICSDINKPNGQFILPNNRMAVMTFISSLPVRKIGGIGKVTERILRDVFEINTCQDMLQRSAFLCALFSHPSSDFFLSVGLGLGQTDTPDLRLRKSLSNERTFSATSDERLFYQKLEELGEMLAIDMQKEGLHGRTLTLKLKTASFEVRTRAVTLQKVISTREEIHTHALKLLKAELPVSLRLIGLRMSHFSEEKVGAPSDPQQKTITSFIASENACGKDGTFLKSCAANNHVNMFCTETGFEIHNKACPANAGLLDNKQLSVHQRTSSSNDGDEAEETHRPSNAKISEKLQGSIQSGTACKRANHDVGTSVYWDEQKLWIDDYKCSLCGIELPPNFIEERQEHSDFHLAEKLQGNEAAIYPTNSPTTKSFIEKGGTKSLGRHEKKRKKKVSSGEGKHLTIDLFFGS